MDAPKLASRFSLLSERFRLASGYPRSPEVWKALGPLIQEAGQALLDGVISGLLPVEKDFADFAAESRAGLKQASHGAATIPSHKRFNPSDTMGACMDASCRIFTTFCDIYLKELPTHPPDGFSSFDTRGMDEGQQRWFWIQRAHGLAACCDLLEEKLLTDPVARAYRAAGKFVSDVGTLAWHVRHYERRPDQPEAWQKHAATYASAFLAYDDLQYLLTSHVRTVARGVHGQGPPIKIGKARPTHSVIEAVADELGVSFRNAMYAGRKSPLDPDLTKAVAEARAAYPNGWSQAFDELRLKERAAVRERLGLKTELDALMLMVGEWKGQDPEWAESHIRIYGFRSIDFDDLKVRLDRESLAALAWVPARMNERARRSVAPEPWEQPVQPAASSPPIGPRKSGSTLVLRDEHLNILAELDTRTLPVKAGDLAGKGGMPCYDTLLDMLRELEGYKLVSRPFGSRSGFVIDERGRAELKYRGLILDSPTSDRDPTD